MILMKVVSLWKCLHTKIYDLMLTGAIFAQRKQSELTELKLLHWLAKHIVTSTFASKSYFQNEPPFVQHSEQPSNHFLPEHDTALDVGVLTVENTLSMKNIALRNVSCQWTSLCKIFQMKREITLVKEKENLITLKTNLSQ
jgi:hypothetical protein